MAAVSVDSSTGHGDQYETEWIQDVDILLTDYRQYQPAVNNGPDSRRSISGPYAVLQKANPS